VELLQFKGQVPGKHAMGYISKFDSGTTCILMPNTTLDEQLDASPFETLLNLQLKGDKRSLFYTLVDENHRAVKMEIEYEHCVEPTAYHHDSLRPLFQKVRSGARYAGHECQAYWAKKTTLPEREEEQLGQVGRT